MRINEVRVRIEVDTDVGELATGVTIDGLVVENDIRGPGVAIASQLILPLHNIEKMIDEARANQKRAEG